MFCFVFLALSNHWATSSKGSKGNAAEIKKEIFWGLNLKQEAVQTTGHNYLVIKHSEAQ